VGHMLLVRYQCSLTALNKLPSLLFSKIEAKIRGVVKTRARYNP
jgi:hypothetical protein